MKIDLYNGDSLEYIKTFDFTIMDPFMGCGNIIQVCKQYGFNFIGCEIDKEYFEIAKQQLQEEPLTQEAI